MKKLTGIAGIALAVALLAGCASTPERDPQIDAAREQITILSQDPLAPQVAARDLDAARSRLQEAETALEQHRPLPQVDHLAYLARRHAEAGEARVQAAHAQQEVARAQEQRNQILLAARARQAEAAQSQARMAESQARAARSQADASAAQLADAQRQLEDLKAKPTDRGMVLTLGDVLFDTGRATLKPGADLALDRLAHYLQEHPNTKVVIEGFTDSRGSDEYNDELSQRRADAVAHALMARGMPADDLRAVGRGKNFPVATNDTEAGRQQNRRVEIVFSDANGRFAESDLNEPVRR
ncbi:MAG TPA: OmpA family protein [Steroidobacteraceae bacterium]|jgi:outer membrane protein OmpA-like peptidoglycan-associated protein|nr:OmpA family protein [Steroidobacteraceae bacterium]